MNDIASSPPSAAPAGSVDEFLGVEAAPPWYRRKLVIAGLIAVLVILVIVATMFGKSSTQSYATEAVQRGDLTVAVSATGNIQPTNQVEVGSEQSGLVEAVYVDNNDRVTKGQPLARLDTSRLTDTLNQARASLAAAQAGVATAQATAVQASANLLRQEEVWRLSGGKVPAEVELDTARAEARRGQAGIRSAQAQVAQAQAQVATAQTNLSKATIYSPVNGVVLSRAVDPGQTVAASLSAPTLFTLAEDLSQMELQVKVDEADVGQVQAGQSASFTVDAYPGKTFQALLKRVDLGANASDGGSTSTTTSSSSNVVAYRAILTVNNPDLLLRPGMTATADIVTSTRKNVLMVPNAAFRFRPAATAQGSNVTSMLMPRARRSGQKTATIGRGSSQTVYVLNADGQPEARSVTVGNTNGNQTEITGGQLKQGEQVITGQLSSGSEGSGSRRQASQDRHPPLVADRRRA